MPTAVEIPVLRGLMAQVAREQNKSIENVSRFDVRGKLVAGGFNPLTGNEISIVLAALREGPYPTHGPGKIAEFSFGYWFNYFYKELPGLEKLKVAVHVINDDGSLRTEAEVPNKIQLFQRMLALGFKQFAAADHLTASQIMAHAISNLESNAQNTLQRDNVNILFRGDGRLPAKIEIDDGTRPQSRIEFLRGSRGMQNFWHPFLNQGNAVWVRNGDVNKDNCLFSAVSVTPQFGVATKFPMLGDLIGSNPTAVGHAFVTVRRRGAAAPAGGSSFQQARQRFTQTPSNDGTEILELPASKTNIYCVRMQGGYNTQKYQGNGTFPEYASDDLGWADHLLWLSVTRIHFDQADANLGHIIVVNEYQWLKSDQIISAALMGPVSLVKLKRFVDDIVARGNVAAGGIVYTPPGVAPPAYDIVRITQPFMQGKAGAPAPVGGVARPAGPAPGRIRVPDAFTRPT